MSELKQRPSGPDLRVRKDNSKKIRRPTRSASLKTEMAKIVYRDQMREKQTIEGSAVDQAALGTERPIHRAAAIPKTVHQRIVLKRKKNVEKATPQEKPITVDYRDLSAERRRRSTAQQQPAPTAAETIMPTPQERMKAEGKKTLRRNLNAQMRRRGEECLNHFPEVQAEPPQPERSEPLKQIHRLSQSMWPHPAATGTEPTIISDKASALDITKGNIPNAEIKAQITAEVKKTTETPSLNKQMQKVKSNRVTVRASAERHIEIKTAEKAEIHTSKSILPRTALQGRKQFTAVKESAAAYFRKRSQQGMVIRTVTTRQAVKKRTVALVKATVKAIVKTVKSILGITAGAAGGILVPLLIVLMIGALLCSPMGLFLSNDVENELTIQQAMSQLNAEFSDKIREIENSVTHDAKRQEGHRAIWKDILTIYAVKATTGTEQPMDVATMDEAHLESLRNIFWDMNTISHTTETYTETETTEVEVVGEDGEVHTETHTQTVTRTRLAIHIDGKSAVDMATEYGFNQEQLRFVSELLSDEYAELWTILAIPGIGGNDIVEVAEREFRDYGGTACGSRYWPQPEDWCVDFVMWCGNELGYVGASGIFGLGGSNVSAELDSMMGAGAEIYYPGDGTIPQPGDIIAFWDDIGRPGQASDGMPLYQGLLSHTGIVTEGADTTVTIIEGNAGGGGYQNSTIRKNTYSLTGCAWGNTYIFCFVRPQYPFSGLAGSGEFWFSSHNPERVQMLADEDPNYGGHPVTVTDEEMRAIVYTIYREMGTDPDGCMLIAQELRDQFDYLDYIGSDYPSWSEVTWERIIKASWNPDYWNTGKALRIGSEHQYAYDAFQWVFEQGNSAIPHKLFGHMSSNIGFQAPWWYRVAFF